jgi:hypothetical protein
MQTASLSLNTHAKPHGSEWFVFYIEALSAGICLICSNMSELEWMFLSYFGDESVNTNTARQDLARFRRFGATSAH